MAFIRAVTMTVLLSFILVASAAGTFIYLLSGYPSPEIDSFDVKALNSSDTVQSNATIRNLGGEGLVVVQIRSFENELVVNSFENEFIMSRNETRRVTEEIEINDGENIRIAVFAPERPSMIQDRSEIVERIP